MTVTRDQTRMQIQIGVNSVRLMGDQDQIHLVLFWLSFLVLMPLTKRNQTRFLNHFTKSLFYHTISSQTFTTFPVSREAQSLEE